MEIYQKCYGECFYAGQWFPKHSNQNKLGFDELDVFQIDMAWGIVRNGLEKFNVYPGNWVVRDSAGRKTVVTNEEFQRYYKLVHAPLNNAS